ncbi:MAG: YitT family protein [Treponema sp.]|nr:YitT family protein [Treponema sp.]
MPKSHPVLITVKRLVLVLAGAVLMALNINTFVSQGNLIPGGFTGLALLIQKICLQYGSLHVPFSILLFILNSVPAVICFKFVGKKFTAYSCLMILVCGLLTDWMPQAKITVLIINAIRLQDTLLSAVFGGILNAVATALCLYADASGGGTDFIAIIISEKYRMDSWNQIFAGNCIILAVAAFLFSLDRALYSIIFQYVTTVSISVLYKGYQQKTLFVITDKPDEISALIYRMTNHGATTFEGLGKYENAKRVMLYSVVAANEVDHLIKGIKEIDYAAFINIIKTEQLNGRFYIRPKD